MVGFRNAEESTKKTTRVRITSYSARAAAERTAARERRKLRLAKRASEERMGETGSVRRVPPVVGIGTGVFVGTAKPEVRMTAADVVVEIPSNLAAGEWVDVRPSGREGKYV